MRSRSTCARTVRALAEASLAAALIAALLALAGCGLLGGGTTPRTPTPAPSANATASVDTTGTGEAPSPKDEAETTPVQASVATPKGVSGGGAARRARSARVICVDTRPEYREEHVKGAVSVPMKSLVDASSGWRKGDDILVTSASEARAFAAASYLTRNGFTDVYYLQGAYDGWNGTFEGTDARVRTRPAEVYYLYSGDEDLFIGATGATFQDTLDLTDDMEAIKKEFGDVSFTFVDVSDDPAEAARLADKFDIPSTNLGFGEVRYVPHWVLVDWNGKVRHFNVVPIMPQIQFVFGFITAEVERLATAQ